MHDNGECEMTRFDKRSTAEDVTDGIDLVGRHAIVTGANTGIGIETARVLALRGAEVTLACRDLAKGRAARELVARQPGVSDDAVRLQQLDLASLGSVRAASRDLLASSRPIHLLINNAGVMLPDRRETQDGFEAHLGTNHLGHFLLTDLLLERIRASAPARIIAVSSSALQFATLEPELEDLNWETRKFSGWRAYGDSKLMNVLFARELSRRLAGEGVVAHALHPGIVKTELGRDQGWGMRFAGIFMRALMKHPNRGAATTLYAATAPQLAAEGGGYFADCAPSRAGKRAEDRTLSQVLWKRSEELTS